MFLRFSALVLSFCICAAPALAADGVYLEARGGLSQFDNQNVEVEDFSIDEDLSYDDGFLAQAAVGYAHAIGLRGELWVGYQTAEIDEVVEISDPDFNFDDEVETYSAMGNLYLDLYLRRFGLQGPLGNLGVFVGGGAGVTVVDLGSDAKDAMFGYNVSGGLLFDITQNFGVSLQYMRMDTESLKLIDGVDGDFSSHNFMAGVRLTF